MVKKDIFDEIIGFLSENGDACGYAEIDRNLLKKFYSDIPETRNDMIKENKTDISYPSSDSSKDIQHSAPGDRKVIPSALQENVSACRSCRLHLHRKNTIFGIGKIPAELMFVGDEPEEEEDERGIPLVGKAGQLLTKMIGAMQFDRQDVYITNIVKCRPPDNRTPLDDEINQCLAYLENQIVAVRPKVLVLLGAVPLKALFNKVGITKIHGQWLEYKGIKTMPIFHPSYLLRNPSAKKDAWEDLQKVMAIFGKIHSK